MDNTTLDSIEFARDFLRKRAGVDPDKISADATLADIGVDSMTLLELVFEIEEKFDIAFPQDIPEFKTLGEFIAFAEKLRDEKQSA